MFYQKLKLFSADGIHEELKTSQDCNKRYIHSTQFITTRYISALLVLETCNPIGSILVPLESREESTRYESRTFSQLSLTTLQFKNLPKRHFNVAIM